MSAPFIPGMPTTPAMHIEPVTFEDRWPKRNAQGDDVWACCESSIGPKCVHLEHTVVQ